jgi:hypothetical protein
VSRSKQVLIRIYLYIFKNNLSNIKIFDKNIKNKILKKAEKNEKNRKDRKKAEKTSKSRIFLLKAEEVAGLGVLHVKITERLLNHRFLFCFISSRWIKNTISSLFH